MQDDGKKNSEDIVTTSKFERNHLICDDLLDGFKKEDFSKCLNLSKPSNNQAYIQYDNKTRQFWARCPYCGKKAFPVSEGAIIKNQEFKCRGSNCKKMFLVDTGEWNE